MSEDPAEGKPQPETSEVEPSEEIPSEISEEEQMARYEESLMDTDWGHQPC